MLKYAIRRMLELIPTTVGIVLLAFALFNVVGGSPAEVVLGKNATAESIAAFASAYAAALAGKVAEVQSSYRARRPAFDGLFADRPFDTNGSGAYRWACILRRLDACDPERAVAILKAAIEC